MPLVAKDPFQFSVSMVLTQLTGLKAHNLKEFVSILKRIDESTIFTHTLLRRTQDLNDFARWIGEVVTEPELSEKIASLSLWDFHDLVEWRDQVVKIIEEHLNRVDFIRSAPPGEEFYFLRSVAVVSKTRETASTVLELGQRIRSISEASLFFHFFEARFRLKKATNDFSNWLEAALGQKTLADKISALDPYSLSLAELRERIASILAPEPFKWLGIFSQNIGGNK
jgi:hypothetical protein